MANICKCFEKCMSYGTSMIRIEQTEQKLKRRHNGVSTVLTSCGVHSFIGSKMDTMNGSLNSSCVWRLC